MIFSFHNRLMIKTKNKSYEFYNTILKSTLIQLSEFQKYNEYISLGNGLSNPEFQNQYKLSNHLNTSKLTNQSFQSDITKGNLFAKYEFLINSQSINSNHITEVGLSNNLPNPTIFNYFSLVSNETPNGLNIENEDELIFEITINLIIIENNGFMLTSGKNPFIEFLLGNGIYDIYICSGSNFSSINRISRVIDKNKTKYLCTKASEILNNVLEINFNADLSVGELDEILFISNDAVFARKNVQEFKEPLNETLNLTAKGNYIIKINEDIKQVNSITNLSSNSNETNYFVSKYANSLGDKLSLPFNNLFNETTSRFLSKDGKLLFFILNEKVYGYINQDFCINELDTKAVDDEYISNIISFDKFVFIITKIHPFISTYEIFNNTLRKVNNNFSEIEDITQLETYLQVDITLCNNNKFILGMITKLKNAISIYFDYSEINGFVASTTLTNNKEFNYLLAMYKNSFCDGQMMFLKEGENSASCRIVTHSADETETDIYSSLAYHLCNNSKNVYCKSRAIISEKNSSTSVVIYYYPQIYQYNLPLISTEIKNYISNNLNYIIQEFENNIYKIYNLVGYDTPEEFSEPISNFVEPKKILSFEFMNDSLIIFQADETEPVVAFNLKLNKTQIENLSSKNSNYSINLTKYNKLGTSNENINISLTTRIGL